MLNDKFVPVVVQAAAPLKLTVDVPRVRVRAVEPVVASVVPVTVKFPELNEPPVRIIAPDVKALPRVHPPPTPLNVSGVVASEMPLVVSVLPVVVAENVTIPDTDQVMPVAARVKLPAIVDVPDPEKVTFPVTGPATDKSEHVAPVATVTV
jgi:hypothetical protein